MKTLIIWSCLFAFIPAQANQENETVVAKVDLTSGYGNVLFTYSNGAKSETNSLPPYLNGMNWSNGVQDIEKLIVFYFDANSLTLTKNEVLIGKFPFIGVLEEHPNCLVFSGLEPSICQIIIDEPSGESLRIFLWYQVSKFFVGDGEDPIIAQLPLHFVKLEKPPNLVEK